MNAMLHAPCRPRKNLSSQLDRLDSILDGLSDGLNEAILTAVREAVVLAVQESVKAVLAEVLTNPALAQLRTGVPVAKKEPARAKRWLSMKLCKLRAWLHDRWSGVRLAWKLGKRQVRQEMVMTFDRLRIVRHFKTQLLLAIGAGIAVGVATYYAGPHVAATASGIGGFGTTLLVQGCWMLRRFIGFYRFPLCSS